jgi:hypothetical protein
MAASVWKGTISFWTGFCADKVIHGRPLFAYQLS